MFRCYSVRMCVQLRPLHFPSTPSCRQKSQNILLMHHDKRLPRGARLRRSIRAHNNVPCLLSSFACMHHYLQIVMQAGLILCAAPSNISFACHIMSEQMLLVSFSMVVLWWSTTICRQRKVRLCMHSSATTNIISL